MLNHDGSVEKRSSARSTSSKNGSKQSDDTRMNKAAERFDKLVKKVDAKQKGDKGSNSKQKIAISNEDCADMEDTISKERIPKKYAIYLDKQCYDARNLWKWAQENKNVPHNRRSLSDQEMEHIRQKVAVKDIKNYATSFDDPSIQMTKVNVYTARGWDKVPLKQYIIDAIKTFLEEVQGKRYSYKYDISKHEMETLDIQQVSLLVYKYQSPRRFDVVIIAKCTFEDVGPGWLIADISDKSMLKQYSGTLEGAISYTNENIFKIFKDPDRKLILRMDRISLPLQLQQGGSVKYQGRSYNVRTGKLGGKYILVNGSKKYI